jgi:hypothetical protein
MSIRELASGSSSTVLNTVLSAHPARVDGARFARVDGPHAFAVTHASAKGEVSA